MWGLRSWIRSLKSKSSKAQFLVSILKITHMNCLDNTHFLQKIDIILAKHINTARLTFPRYSLQCDLYSCGVLLQWLSLHVLFFWWTHPRGVVATFQLLQLRMFPLRVLVFLHQIDCNPSSQVSSDQCLSND